MKLYTKIISLAILIITVFYSIYFVMPRSISDKNKPLNEFSTKRALIPLKEISKKAHYLGSKEHKRVREYIVAELNNLGLEVEIQEQEIFNSSSQEGAKVYNIIAKIKGSKKGKAVMISTHYDSATSGAIGTSDAGSGVVTVLEGVRAYLASGEKPKNDIVILITDGEEIGLLGATAFADKHHLAKEIGVALNFEARGTGGPSYMFMETNGGNKNLVRKFQKANAQYPFATSLMYSLYKQMPNSTDLTAFREIADIDGFNFAFIDDHFDYHTPQDNFERLDVNSLAHQGTYLMATLQYFANADLSNIKADKDYVYFNFPIVGMVYYPFSWILPMLIMVILAFVVLIYYGIKQQKIKPTHALLGFLPFIIALLVSGFVTKYAWVLLTIIYPQYNDIHQGFTYNGYTYIFAFSSLTLAICFTVYRLFSTKISSINMLIAPIFIWIVISTAVAIYLQGAAYFVISVLVGIISLATMIFSKLSDDKTLLLLSIISLPILLIFVPNVQMFPVGLGLNMLFVSSILIVLIFGLVVPITMHYRSFKLSVVFTVVTIILLITASYKADYNKDRKKPNMVNYVLNTDTNKAYWESNNSSVDEFTAQFFGENPEINENSYYKFLKDAPAPLKPITAPNIVINKDTTINNLRHIDLDIITLRNAKHIRLFANDSVSFYNFEINGYKIKKNEDSKYLFTENTQGHLLSYNFAYGDSILNLKFTIRNNDKPEFKVLEASYDLLTNSNFNIKPRQNNMMLNTFSSGNLADAIIVQKSFTLDKN